MFSRPLTLRYVVVIVTVVAGGSGLIRMSSSALTSSPLSVQLYSRGVSSRLSVDPVCLYFRYYVHGGVDGHLSVYTLDNADAPTVQWTLRGHLMQSWQFGFVQINTVGGPYQVLSFSFMLTQYSRPAVSGQFMQALPGEDLLMPMKQINCKPF